MVRRDMVDGSRFPITALPMSTYKRRNGDTPPSSDELVPSMPFLCPSSTYKPRTMDTNGGRLLCNAHFDQGRLLALSPSAIAS